MAYDPTLRSVVLFGGYNASSFYPDSDTWTFANNSWTDITANLSTSPPGRWGATLVWDAKDGYLVMFGGRDSAAFFNDTWTFNGTAWTNVTPTLSPPARSLYQMAYDPVDSAVILDGGFNSSPTTSSYEAVNDTWSYVAGVWKNISAPAPGGALSRVSGQAVYDPWNGSVVFIGGITAASLPVFGCQPTAPVQTYVNRTWYEYPTSVGPPNVSEEMAAYDSAAQFIFVFGGFGPAAPSPSAACVQLNYTWIRSSGVWLNLSASLTTAPSTRYLSGMTFDAALDEIVLFGGNSNGNYVGDTWVFVNLSLSLADGIHASRTAGLVPFTVDLSAPAYGGTPPYSYNWTFGDGSTSNAGENVSHTYTTAGQYEVSVDLTDNASHRATAFLNLTTFARLVVATSVSQSIGSAPLSVNLTGRVTGGDAPFRFSWSFGDGNTASAENVTHTYTVSGNYTPTLTVTDSLGDKNQSSQSVAIAPELAATATASTILGEAPLVVNFTSVTSGGNGADSYLWQFGDQTNSTLPDPTHVYNAAGVYNVSLRVNDALGHVVVVRLSVGVVRDLTTSIAPLSFTGVAPFEVTFTANASGGAGPYVDSWNFGDGSGAVQGEVVEHTYPEKGTFPITLETQDALGDTAMAIGSVVVVAPLSAKLPATTPTGEAPDPVTFSFSNFTGGVGPYTFNWTFGDGTTHSGGSQANHTYAAAGTYQPKVTVRDSLGESSSASSQVVVLPAVGLEIDNGFGTIVTGISANLSVTLHGGQGPFAIQWTGLPTPCVSENAATLVCTPTRAGTFNVTVSVTDAFGRVASTNGTVMVENEIAAPNPSSSSGSGISLFDLGIIVTLAIVAAFAVGFVLFRRRREPAGTPEPAGELTGDGLDASAPPDRLD